MKNCPCCSGKNYDECCGPILKGEVKAATAEALMRSRYTAYATGDLAHLRKTLVPKNQDTYDEEATRTWSSDSEWIGLEIVAKEAGTEKDESGIVEFIAKYQKDGQTIDHHERATFKKIEGIWYFQDGKLVGKEPYIRSTPKIGRNDPCPCGSGKKYKKCCG